jgi:hypothetical protein
VPIGAGERQKQTTWLKHSILMQKIRIKYQNAGLIGNHGASTFALYTLFIIHYIMFWNQVLRLENQSPTLEKQSPMFFKQSPTLFKQSPMFGLTNFDSEISSSGG